MIIWEEKTPDALTRPLSQRKSDIPVLPSPLAVVWRSSCRNLIYEHVRTSKEERGGLLLGTPWHDDASPTEPRVIDVVECVPAVQSDGTPISLSMGADVWTDARERASATEPALMVVGWYHSHPGLTAFFSGTDRQTQAAFFREDWHLGLCVDPTRDDEAWFVGATSEQVAAEHIFLVE